MNLKYFTQSEILQQIGSRRLQKLFDGLRNGLEAETILIPTPESENGSYFDSLAAALALPASLPEPVQVTLLSLEAAASPENQALLDSTIQRRIPSVSLSNCPVDRALELWFHVPEELAQFQDVAQASRLRVHRASSPGVPSQPESESPQNASPTKTPKHGSTETPPSQQNAPPSPAADVPAPFLAPEPAPWPEPVNLKILLDRLVELLKRLVILPAWAAETLALWIVHTYAFHLRDVTTYIGIESPEKRCGKTTLLSVLNELAHRALASSNISPPAFFRVIEDLCPTLLIDEVDTFLSGNEQLRGILNAGYNKKTAFVLRAAASAPSNGENEADSSAPVGAVKRFSCWCPKVLAKIGRFPDTLADRCIIIRMHRKTSKEQCDRSRELDAQPLKRQCLRFVADHAAEIASAKPQIPPELNDRAADIWEPLLALADLAGGDWPDTARKAAVSLSASAQESNPISSLLLDIFVLFATQEVDRMFTQTLIAGLNSFGNRPWIELLKGKGVTDLWLAQQLRPYGVKPRTMRIGENRAKGYLQADLLDVFRRYIPRSELDALLAEHTRDPDELPQK